MNIPRLTDEQLKQARAAATAARAKRAAFKAQIGNREITFCDALDLATQDDVLAHIKVCTLLKSMPRIGDKRASLTVERLGISPNRRIRGLGKHQIDALKQEFATK
ncbi:MAG: 30S ribosomal protein S13 [Propionibacteriaceae bacterium]|nr:30S ribosomal protein S13 [Propionibacteriaceae bacterium]